MMIWVANLGLHAAPDLANLGHQPLLGLRVYGHRKRYEIRAFGLGDDIEPYRQLQDRIDAMYIDKLDGRLSQVDFDRKADQWRAEQGDVEHQIELHRGANQSYIAEGCKILELAQRAVALYDTQEMREKRRLIRFVFSNSQWKDGQLIPAYRQPFGYMAVATEEAKRKKATSLSENGLCSVWHPKVAQV